MDGHEERGSAGFTSSSPADKAGIRDGDVVLRFAGVDIIDLNHLINHGLDDRGGSDRRT